MSFNWVDLLIIAVVVISALISLLRGFVKEALSLVIWFLAGTIAWMFGGGLAHYFSPYIESESLQVLAACGALFIASLIAGAALSFLLSRLIHATGLSGTDRFLGVFFGAARGGLLVAIAVGLLDLSPLVREPAWRESNLIPHFLLVADWSKNMVIDLSAN